MKSILKRVVPKRCVGFLFEDKKTLRTLVVLGTHLSSGDALQDEDWEANVLFWAVQDERLVREVKCEGRNPTGDPTTLCTCEVD